MGIILDDIIHAVIQRREMDRACAENEGERHTESGSDVDTGGAVTRKKIKGEMRRVRFVTRNCK